MNDMQQTQNSQDNADLAKIFQDFIKPGIVEKEKEVVPSWKVRLKVLSIGELTIAESIIGTDKAPVDIVAKVRAAKILSQAITAINGSEIERNDMSKEEIRIRRHVLYNQLLELPGVVVQRTYEFYIECANEQNAYYEDPKELQETLRNFYPRHSEQ